MWEWGGRGRGKEEDKEERGRAVSAGRIESFLFSFFLSLPRPQIQRKIASYPRRDRRKNFPSKVMPMGAAVDTRPVRKARN